MKNIFLINKFKGLSVYVATVRVSWKVETENGKQLIQILMMDLLYTPHSNLCGNDVKFFSIFSYG